MAVRSNSAQISGPASGLGELGPGHHGVWGLHDLDQGAGVHDLFVLAAAGTKKEGNAGDVLGNGVDAGMDPDVLFVRVRDPAKRRVPAAEGLGEEKAVYIGERGTTG